MSTQPHRTERSILPDLVGLGFLAFLIVLFFQMETIQGWFEQLFEEDGFPISFSQDWLNVNTIFLSIVIEAVPFLMLGVFVSALIQVFIKEETLQRFLPKNPILGIGSATVMGAILPICECAIVPVVRRLLRKGIPLYAGVVFLVAAPVLNPVTVASTFFAFRTDPVVTVSRFALAFVLAIVIGLIMYAWFKNRNQLRANDEHDHHAEHVHDGHDHHHAAFAYESIAEQREQKSEQAGQGERAEQVDPTVRGSRPPTLLNRLKQTLNHAADEFFDMGKYLIVGAFIAALFQTFLDRQLLHDIGSNEWSSTFVMMVFAYVLSLCSEADAFVAASFGSMFTTGSLVAFLVYGPMLDLKNTIMLFAYFKPKFVIGFMITVTIAVFGAIMFMQVFDVFSIIEQLLF